MTNGIDWQISTSLLWKKRINWCADSFKSLPRLLKVSCFIWPKFWSERKKNFNNIYWIFVFFPHVTEVWQGTRRNFGNGKYVIQKIQGPCWSLKMLQCWKETNTENFIIMEIKVVSKSSLIHMSRNWRLNSNNLLIHFWNLMTLDSLSKLWILIYQLKRMTFLFTKL